MDTKEPLLRSDWAIYRGGAVFFEGTEDCALEDSFIDQVGGNAVFVNHYNRRITVRGCRIAKAGASGIGFFGDPQAARNPLFNYNQVNRSSRTSTARPVPKQQLSGRLPGGRLPDLSDRPRGKTDRRSADRSGPGHHHPPLLDLRHAARRHQHRRRLLGRARHRVLRRVRHREGNRRPRLVQLLGTRPVLAAQHRRGQRLGEGSPRTAAPRRRPSPSSWPTTAGAATTAGTSTSTTVHPSTSSPTTSACVAASRTAKATGVSSKTTSRSAPGCTRMSGMPRAATSSAVTSSGASISPH
jgi:hypothetical protein